VGVCFEKALKNRERRALQNNARAPSVRSRARATPSPHSLSLSLSLSSVSLIFFQKQQKHQQGWISWAQLEKRVARAAQADPRRAVAILQVAAAAQLPDRAAATAPILQAWALLELQRGNARAATNLLARAVAADPARCSPVLRWAPVKAAAAEVGHRGLRGRSSGGGGGEGPLPSS
jgi:hypothetical protein